jgi:hypothetical protein
MKEGIVPALSIKYSTISIISIGQAVCQVVFTDVLIVGLLDVVVRALLLLAYTKQTLHLIGCS